MTLLEAIKKWQEVNGETFGDDPFCDCPTCEAGRDVQVAIRKAEEQNAA